MKMFHQNNEDPKLIKRKRIKEKKKKVFTSINNRLLDRIERIHFE